MTSQEAMSLRHQVAELADTVADFEVGKAAWKAAQALHVLAARLEEAKLAK